MATNGAVSLESGEAPNTNSNSNLSKDEVAWFFVEQYYTTLSKTPEKLHLFYGKRSQFVYGQEAQVANVSVGRQAIQERIQALGFQDSQTKVRVSNVDSQSSFDNIVIQVIGETSGKAGDEPKKFVQTFVLAEQPAGYFVLNDIVRYIDDENEEEQADVAEPEDAEEDAAHPAEIAAEPEPAVEVSEAAHDAPASSLNPEVVSEKLQEISTAAPAAPAAPVNGTEEQEEVDDDDEEDIEEQETAPAAAQKESAPDPEEAVRELEEEEVKQPERPSDPSPTPAPAREAPAPAAPAQAPAPVPAQPAKPMTWASRLAASGPPKPVVPLAQPKAAPAPTTAPAQPRSGAPTAAAPAPQQAPAATPTPAAAPTEASTGNDSTEWKTAGSDSKRHHRPGQSISGPPPEKEGVLGYIKYVTDKVQQEDLRAALAKYGEVVYFDINRTKNCAFVEFATPIGYQAAQAANPHEVNGESIVVEPRRPKASAYGGTNYGGNRGSISGPRGGRGGFDGPRTGGQGGRGNFNGQNRGGRGAPRGRGGPPQPTNA